MTKRKALRLLQKQRNSLSEATVCTQQWVDDTHERIVRIFGDHNSAISIASFGQYTDLQKNRSDPEYAVKQLYGFFNVWIDQIKDGLYKTDEKSFIDGFRNSQLMKWGLFLCFGCFIAGYIFGAYNNPKSVFNKIVVDKIGNVIGIQTK